MSKLGRMFQQKSVRGPGVTETRVCRHGIDRFDEFPCRWLVQLAVGHQGLIWPLTGLGINLAWYISLQIDIFAIGYVQIYA